MISFVTLTRSYKDYLMTKQKVYSQADHELCNIARFRYKYLMIQTLVQHKVQALLQEHNVQQNNARIAIGTKGTIKINMVNERNLISAQMNSSKVNITSIIVKCNILIHFSNLHVA